MKYRTVQAHALEDEEGNVVYLIKDPHSDTWMLLWPGDESANADNLAALYDIASMRLAQMRRNNKEINDEQA